MAKKDSDKPKYKRRYCIDCRYFAGRRGTTRGYCTFARDVCGGMLYNILYPLTTYECIRFARRHGK